MGAHLSRACVLSSRLRSYLKNGGRVHKPYGSARAADERSSGARKEVEMVFAAWLLNVGNQSPGEPVKDAGGREDHESGRSVLAT